MRSLTVKFAIDSFATLRYQRYENPTAGVLVGVLRGARFRDRAVRRNQPLMLKPDIIQTFWLKHRLTFSGTYCYVLTSPARVLAASSLPT